MPLSEGAAILLTWIINFVKWNAGHTRYKFEYGGANEVRSPNPRILNNQLVPVQTGKVQVGPDGREITTPDENEHILHPTDGHGGYEAHFENIQKA